MFGYVFIIVGSVSELTRFQGKRFLKDSVKCLKETLYELSYFVPYEGNFPFYQLFSFMEDQDAKLPLKSFLNYNETQMAITTSVVE